MNEKYPAHEKLKQKKQIELLFAKGKWLSCGNLRVISLDLDKKPQDDVEVSNLKVGVSVSKKYFKKAVHRNRIKRLLREMYRHNKAEFSARFGERSLSMIFWVSKEMPPDFETLQQNFLTLCNSKK